MARMSKIYSLSRTRSIIAGKVVSPVALMLLTACGSGDPDTDCVTSAFTDAEPNAHAHSGNRCWFRFR